MSARYHLAARVAKALGVSERRGLVYIDALFTAMREGLAEDGRIEIRDIGVWRTKFRPKTIRTIHLWKKKAVYGGMVKIYFKPGVGLRSAVNGGQDYVWSKNKNKVRLSSYPPRRDKVCEQEGSGEVPRVETTPKSWRDSRS